MQVLNHITVGVMLSLSKHRGRGLSVRTLRQAQSDTALCIIFAFVFCLFLSTNILAQGTDTTHKGNPAIYQFRDVGSLPNRTEPLIVLDGVPYNPKSDKLESKDIQRIDVLKDGAANALYGSQASLGVIWITTNRLNKKRLLPKNNLVSLFVDNNALYVIDGEVSQNKLNGADLQNLLSITILKKFACDACYVNVRDHGAVIVVTKQGAVKSYQKKFSALSIKYKDFIEHHQDNDDSINYVVNGIFLRLKSADPIRDLYEIPANKIKMFDFIKNEYYNGGDSRPYLAIITTMQ